LRKLTFISIVNISCSVKQILTSKFVTEQVKTVFTAVRIIMMFLWVLAPCRLVGQKNGVSVFLRNTDIYRWVYTTPKPKRSSSGQNTLNTRTLPNILRPASDKFSGFRRRSSVCHSLKSIKIFSSHLLPGRKFMLHIICRMKAINSSPDICPQAASPLHTKK
jgi:hypothetical protein